MSYNAYVSGHYRPISKLNKICHRVSVLSNLPTADDQTNIVLLF